MRTAQAYITARTITPQFVPESAEDILISDVYKKNKFQQKLLSQKHKQSSCARSQKSLIAHDIEASVQENSLKNSTLSIRFKHKEVTGFGENGCLGNSRQEAT